MSVMRIAELPTPHFLVSEARLLTNLQRVDRLRKLSGAKVVLALKCFSTWALFDVMRPYLDGTTSSSVYEARLGFETFGGETHAYSVGFSAEDVSEVDRFADKIIFNSLSQFAAHAKQLRNCRAIGMRINPGLSYAHNTLADPARQYSRLGVRKPELVTHGLSGIEGAMIHFNCENKDHDAFATMLERISNEFADVLARLSWVSLGGGVLFTENAYPLDQFAALIKQFTDRHGVQVYLEPGEAVVTQTTDLVVTVLDIVDNEMKTAIVDSASEAHRLDTLIFQEPASVREADPSGEHVYIIGASSCLAGDAFCTAKFRRPLAVGDRLHIMDSGGYTMVKLNWFNGLRMPSIYCVRTDGQISLLNQFGYFDFKRMLSNPTTMG